MDKEVNKLNNASSQKYLERLQLSKRHYIKIFKKQIFPIVERKKEKYDEMPKLRLFVKVI